MVQYSRVTVHYSIVHPLYSIPAILYKLQYVSVSYGSFVASRLSMGCKRGCLKRVSLHSMVHHTGACYSNGIQYMHMQCMAGHGRAVKQAAFEVQFGCVLWSAMQ